MSAEPVEQKPPGELNESRAARAKDLFLTAAELPIGDRAAYMDRECAGDAELRARVEALLAAHDLPGSFPAGVQPPVMATLDSRPGETPSGKNGGGKPGDPALDA